MTERAPKFLRAFSKETNRDARKQTAVDIVNARKQERTRREYHERLVREIALLQNEEAAIEAGALHELAEKINTLDDQLSTLQQTWFSRIRNGFEIDRAREQLDALHDEENNTLARHAHKRLEREERQRMSATLAARHPDPGGDILTTFYAHEQKRWANAEVNWETIDRYFSPEHLASASMEEYVLLLRRFPQEMVTHVSRRGIRDHAKLSEHQDDQPYRHHDAFDRLLEDGHLQSAVGIKLRQDTAEAYVAGELRLYEGMSREDAEANLQRILHHRGWASFADHTAVHFAAEDVAHEYYGSERGNETFVAYPSALIAAAYEFGGHYTDLSKPNSDATRNDVWVWAKEEEGLPLNAGIVFLPSDSRVDPKTGSRYQLTPENTPIFDPDATALYDRLATNEALHAFILESYRSDLTARERIAQEENYNTIRIDTRYAQEGGKLRNAFNERLASEFDVRDTRVQDQLYGMEGKRFTRQIQAREQWERDMYRNRFLQDAGIHLKAAEHTVSGKEFWEAYFVQHPHRQPSKIVYYEGGDPMKALHDWRHTNGITRTSKEVGIDYTSREDRADRMVTSSAATRFEAIARDVIARHFSDTPFAERVAS